MIDYPIPSLALAVGGLAVLVALFRWVRLGRQGSGKAGPDSIAASVGAGAYTFLRRHYLAAWIAVLILALMLERLGAWVLNGFVSGAALAALAGYFGLAVTLRASARAAQAAERGTGSALTIALSGGQAVGLMSAGLAVAGLAGFLWLAKLQQIPAGDAWRGVLGLALGSGLLSLAGRLSAGLYAKPADIGADQAGKAEAGLADNDPRNAGAIAELAGDHVTGAGTATDVFATTVLLLAAALGLARNVFGDDNPWQELPLGLAGLGLAASILGGLFARAGRRPRIIGTLYRGLLISALLMGAAVYYAADPFLALPDVPPVFDRFGLAAIAGLGLALLLLLAVIAEHYAARNATPARRVAEAAATGPATNLLAGLSIGMRSTLLPILATATVLAAAHHLAGGADSPSAGLYAIALVSAVLASMAGTLGSLAAFGTVADGAAGLTALTEFSDGAGAATRAMDNAGHTVRAIVRTYLLAGAGLIGLLLLSGYVRAFGALALPEPADPLLLLGLVAGALLPYWFGARLLGTAGRTAGRVAEEIRAQLGESPAVPGPGLEPGYGRCLDIAARSFVFPSALPLLAPLALPALVGLAAGQQALGALLLGSLVAGLPMALAMAGSGCALDGARRHIEEGRLGGEQSPAHRAALAGDAVGDAAKDGLAPALGAMLQVLFLVALLIAPLLSA